MKTERSSTSGPALSRFVVRLGASLGVAFLAVPLGVLCFTLPWDAFTSGLARPAARDALVVSLQTTAASLALVLLTGTPMAWLLAQVPAGTRLRRRERLRAVLEALVALPAVLPPAVAGVALLLVFGRRGVPGAWLDAHGLSPAFTAVAVVLAQAFVALPVYAQAATSAFRRVDPRRIWVARSLGAGPARAFWAVAVPLALPGILGGAALAWARALGEFGATLLFAGSLPGRTQTLPLAIYAALETDLHAAQALSVLLVAVALLVLVLLRTLAPAS